MRAAWCELRLGQPNCGSQLAEDAMHLAVTQWQAVQSPPASNEERRVVVAILARQVAPQAILTQRLEGAGMYGHLARLAELGPLAADKSPGTQRPAKR